MTSPLLAIRGLRAAYGKIEALKGVDLEINPGEIVALIGANGAGKSTLMMTIFGNPRAREGRIVFAGRDITQLPTHEIARLHIAQSPEGRRIFPRMTVLIVEQNANHALKLAHRGYVMVNGLITLSGTGAELLQRPEIRAAYLEGGRRG